MVSGPDSPCSRLLVLRPQRLSAKTKPLSSSDNEPATPSSSRGHRLHGPRIGSRRAPPAPPSCPARNAVCPRHDPLLVDCVYIIAVVREGRGRGQFLSYLSITSYVVISYHFVFLYSMSMWHQIAQLLEQGVFLYYIICYIIHYIIHTINLRHQIAQLLEVGVSYYYII